MRYYALRAAEFIQEICFQQQLKNILGRQIHISSSLDKMVKKKVSRGKAASVSTGGTGDGVKGESLESPFSVTKDGDVNVRIMAKPGAKQTCITDISSEGVAIQISSPPVDGEANEELVRFLARSLGLRKSDVMLQKGSRSRQKVIIVSGISEVAIKEKLTEISKSSQ